MGDTGMAFHLVMHETCCVSSVTAYDWMNTHLAALNRIGVHSGLRCAPEMPISTPPAGERWCTSGNRRLGNRRRALGRDSGSSAWCGARRRGWVLLTSGCHGLRESIPYENLGMSPEHPNCTTRSLERNCLPTATDGPQQLRYYVDLMERQGHGGYRAAFGLRQLDAGAWLRGSTSSAAMPPSSTRSRACAARYVEHLAEAHAGPCGGAFRRTATIYGRMMEVLGQDLADPSVRHAGDRGAGRRADPAAPGGEGERAGRWRRSQYLRTSE